MIKKYETLLKTIDLGSLTRASEVLGYTQSAISHMITNLEDEMGVKIVIRDRSGVRLTQEGARIIPAIRNVCKANQEVFQQVAEIHSLKVGTIRIGTFLSVSIHVLPDLIAEFSKKHPHVEFELLQGSYSDIERWIAQEKIDFGFLRLPTAHTLQTIPVMTEQFFAIFPETRVPAQDYFPLETLKDENYIMQLDSMEPEMRDLFKRSTFKPKITYSAKDDYAVMAMVERGLGMSILPELLLKDTTCRLRVQHVSPPIHRKIAIAYKDLHAMPPAPRHFLQFAEEKFRGAIDEIN